MYVIKGRADCQKDKEMMKAGRRKVSAGLMTFAGVCVVSLINSLTTHARQMIACAGRPFRDVGGNSLRNKKLIQAIFKDILHLKTAI